MEAAAAYGVWQSMATHASSCGYSLFDYIIVYGSVIVVGWVFLRLYKHQQAINHD